MGKTIRLTNEQEEALSLLDSNLKNAIDILIRSSGLDKFIANLKDRLENLEGRLLKLEGELNY